MGYGALFRFWHFSDLSLVAIDVGSQGQSGSNADIAEQSLLTRFSRSGFHGAEMSLR
jgi:hypothetical protein